MFAFKDFISLVISAFIILPVVILLRELGYLMMSVILGVKNPRITIGTGPRIYKKGIIDIRKYYHLYSWFSYDSLTRTSKFAYVSIYASPIILNVLLALTLNFLVANGYLEAYRSFWDRFIFYAFYYVLFDIVPMITFNGKPNNGMIIYEMLRYGKRVDYNKEPFIPGTTEIEKEHEDLMKELEEYSKKK